MNAMTLVTALQRLAQCLLVSSLLVITGTSQAIERVTYYHNDALGSPVAATDAAGTLLWREEYKPYGDRIKREAGSKDTAWYTGKQEEAEFGISYFGARWYDPKIGRFLAKDPVGFNPDNINSFSKYAYANNNP
jgi:RHS repeat-associated protein